jgi:hypothetical protein
MTCKSMHHECAHVLAVPACESLEFDFILTSIFFGAARTVSYMPVHQILALLAKYSIVHPAIPVVLDLELLLYIMSTYLLCKCRT